MQIEENMTNIYIHAKICPFKNQTCELSEEGLSLTPDLEQIMINSSDYNELTYVWSAWRDATGAKMKKQYQRYVELYNEAAKANGNYYDIKIEQH